MHRNLHRYVRFAEKARQQLRICIGRDDALPGFRHDVMQQERLPTICEGAAKILRVLDSEAGKGPV